MTQLSEKAELPSTSHIAAWQCQAVDELPHRTNARTITGQ